MKIVNRWVVIFLVLPHLNIYFLKLEQVQPIVLLWKSLIIILAVILLFRELNIFNLIMLLMMGLIISTSLYNSTLTLAELVHIGIFISFLIYISYGMRNFKELIKGLYYLFSFLLILNFLTIISGVLGVEDPRLLGVEDYVNHIYLLGHKNSISLTILPAMGLIYLYSHLFYNKLKILPILFILLGILSVYLVGSATGIVIVSLLVLFIFTPRILTPSYLGYMIFFVLLFLSIILFRIQELVFGNLIVNVLEKDITFTGRTRLWDIAMNALESDAFLIGFGRGNSIISDNTTNLTQAHNGILEIALESGIIGVMLFLLILIVVGIKLKSHRGFFYYKILSFSIFAYLLIGLTESVYFRIEFWLILVIAYKANKIKSTYKEIESKAP